MQGAFATYLGVQPQVADWSEDGNAFTLRLTDNPLTDFVELPPKHERLFYSNIIPGLVQGGLEAVCGG